MREIGRVSLSNIWHTILNPVKSLLLRKCMFSARYLTINDALAQLESYYVHSLLSAA
jgi:hypothetical protein